MQLWRFYRKSVGLWEIASNRSPFRYPLRPGGDTSGPVREFFHYLYRALDAAGDLLTLRYVEHPPGHVIIKSGGQLLPLEIQGELIRSWDAEARETGAWKPAALLGGLSRIYVKEGRAIRRAEVPDALKLCLAAAEDRYLLTAFTHNDFWLDRFISGEDNVEAGSLNARALGRALEALEAAVDGKVVRFASEMGAPVNERGFS